MAWVEDDAAAAAAAAALAALADDTEPDDVDVGGDVPAPFP